MRMLVVGPHPDDQELGMGGTIAALVDGDESVDSVSEHGGSVRR